MNTQEIEAEVRRICGMHEGPLSEYPRVVQHLCRCDVILQGWMEALRVVRAEVSGSCAQVIDDNLAAAELVKT